MRLLSIRKILLFVALVLIATKVISLTRTEDRLPSWNDGPTKQSIIRFVQCVTDKSSACYVPPEERIATFDNDGTLWLEQPMYTQALFSFDRIKTLAAKHPEWKTQKPFSLVLSGNPANLKKLTREDLAKIVAVTHSGMSVEAFSGIVKNWLANTKNPHFNQPYTALVYQPMLEVMQYLRANGFTVYIVSGGGQDFIRAYSQSTYQVEPNHVIGTAGQTQYRYVSGQPELIKLPKVILIDDNAGKPESINLFVARKPIIAFGNSDGDREMLEWTQSGKGQRLMLLVHHDDAKREYAYGAKSAVGTFSDGLMKEALAHDWKVISMKEDWKVVFPFEMKK